VASIFPRQPDSVPLSTGRYAKRQTHDVENLFSFPVGFSMAYAKESLGAFRRTTF
jgi:hypothetical protein